MKDLSLEEIGHGREPDVWMGPDVDSLTSTEDRGAHLIEERERPDHP